MNAAHPPPPPPTYTHPHAHTADLTNECSRRYNKEHEVYVDLKQKYEKQLKIVNARDALARKERGLDELDDCGEEQGKEKEKLFNKVRCSVV
jgi:hypothetical protein